MSRTQIVLGSRTLVPNPNAHGTGWGTPHPRAISNWGVPSGRAWKIRWSTWGGQAALGRGLTWLYRPEGGYYVKPGAIELRAYRIGKCSPTGPRAYLHLRARVAKRPGGPLGRWFTWAGLRNLCRWS